MCTGMLAASSILSQVWRKLDVRRIVIKSVFIPTWISGGRTGFSRLHLYLEDDSDEMCVLSG